MLEQMILPAIRLPSNLKLIRRDQERLAEIRAEERQIVHRLKIRWEKERENPSRICEQFVLQ
jgi:hypothetical protein